VGQGVLGAQHADADGALLVQGVLRQNVLVLVDALGQLLQERGHLPQPLRLEVARQSPGPDEARHHTGPAQLLEEVEQTLALAEGVEEDRRDAHIHGVAADGHQMGVDAGQLGQQHASDLGPRGDLAV